MPVNTPFPSFEDAKLTQDDEHTLRHRLGAAIRSARKKKGLKQDQLALALETDSETVSRFERGVALPSLTRLVDIAAALDVTVAFLTGAASPLLTDEWEQIHRDLARLSLDDQRLAAAIVRAVVSSRS